jgi:hypothetical protein
MTRTDNGGEAWVAERRRLATVATCPQWESGEGGISTGMSCTASSQCLL